MKENNEQISKKVKKSRKKETIQERTKEFKEEQNNSRNKVIYQYISRKNNI